MKSDLTKICIVGGGFGGLYTALSLSRSLKNKTGRYHITLVEPKEHFLFTPLLYELVTGELQRWEIAPSYQKLLTGTSIEFCKNAATYVDFKQRQVSLKSGETLCYNYLILAVGNQNCWANIPGLKTHALTFRTLSDVEHLHTQLHVLETSERQRLRLTVIGGGPNGVELACKLADRLGKRGEVFLIERNPDILTGFSKKVRSASYRALGMRRVQVYLQTNVKEIIEDAITITRQEQDIILPTDLTIWVAGTQVRDWIKALDCQHDEQGKLLIESTLQLVDYPDVFALGDLAQICPTNPLIPATAQAAYQQASCAAKNLAAIIEGKPLQAFRYFHLGDMLALGRGDAVVTSFFLKITGWLAAIIRRLAYIFRLPTPRHRLQVLKNLLHKMILKIRRSFRWQLTRLLSQKSARNY